MKVKRSKNSDTTIKIPYLNRPARKEAIPVTVVRDAMKVIMTHTPLLWVTSSEIGKLLGSLLAEIMEKKYTPVPYAISQKENQ